MTKTYASRYDEWADKIMQHVDVPDGLLGSSYHNDLCPSVMTKPIGKGDWYVQLFIDYPDPADREDSDSDRYTLVVMSDDGDHYHHTTDVYGCALTAVLGYRFALTIRDWLTDGEWTAMRAKARQLAADGVTNVCPSHDYCDANIALLDAFTALYGPLPDDRRITDEAHVEMDKAHDFAFTHIFAAEEV
jgi:hypothetical protein